MPLGIRRRLAALTVTNASSHLRHKEKELPSSCSASHPVVAGLHDSANALLGWTEAPAPPTHAGIAWIGDGVDLLTRLLAALADLLGHPQARPPCRMVSPWMERLLHDLVLLADAHLCFCQELLSLKHLLAEAEAGVRRCDAGRLAAALRARHISDRGLSRLSSTLRALSHRSSSPGEAELPVPEAVAVATSVSAAASTAIFGRLASASSALQAFTSLTAVSPAKAMEQLRNLEDCVVAAEGGCDQVRRALVNTRVATLNVLSAD